MGVKLFKMIYKIISEDKTEYAQAKNFLHLIQGYEKEFIDCQDIKEVIEISEDEAKTIMLRNNEYDENDPDMVKDQMDEYFSLYDTVSGDEFMIVGSTEWD